MIFPPFVILCGIIITFSWYSLCSVSPPIIQMEASMAYIAKLPLEHPQWEQVWKFLTEIKKRENQLIMQYKPDEYALQETDERLSIAKDLLSTNIPACSLLLKDIAQRESLSVKQKLLCLHYQYLASMTLGPLSEGLAFAEEQYKLSKNTSSNVWNVITLSQIQQLQFQAASDVGNAHCSLGNLDKAKIFLDEAKEIAIKMADQDNIDLATIYHGNWLLTGGQLKIAMNEVYRPLTKQTLSDSNRGRMLQGYGNACRSAADWGRAKDYLRESIALAEKLGDPVAIADRQGDLGTVYRSEGRIADALKYQKMHYQFAMKRGDRAGLCVACFNLGFTHYSSKPAQFNSAIVFHTIQLEMSHEIGLPGMKSRALNCLGKVYTSLNNYEGAIQLFNECVDLHSETGNIAGLGMAYGNLGTAYRALAQYDEAKIFHQKYEDNARLRDDVGGVAIMQREIALDYMFSGDYEKAESSIKKALITLEEIRMKLGPEDTSRIANYEKNQADTYNLLPTILVKQGKIKEALALSERGRARALADIIRSRLLEFEEQSGVNLDDKLGDVNMDDAIDGAITDSEEDASDIIKLVKKLNTTLIIYSIITEFGAQSNSSKWVYIWVVTMTNTNLNEKLETPSIHFSKMQLTRESKVNAPSGTIDDQYVNSLCRSLGNLSINDGQELTQEYTNKQDAAVTCYKSEVTLNEGYTSTEETRGDLGHAHAYRLPQHPKSIDTGNGKEVKDPSLMDKMKKTPEQQKVYQNLRDNYDLLIAPIEDYLPRVMQEGSNNDGDNAPRIIIIPQDYLFNLPFCALMDQNGKHLIEKYIISFSPSIQVLQLTQRRLNMLCHQNSRASPTVLAVGNPKMPHPKVPQLPAAEREVQMVRSHFGGQPGSEQPGSEQPGSEKQISGSEPTVSLVAVGTGATVHFVREHMTKHDVLHFATHAEQDDGIAEMIREGRATCIRKPSPRGDFNLRGFLVLARSNGSCSGILTAEEIKAQQLKAEVAVLSCCQTGKGQVTGDGVLGLYRAFLAAGAASVVVTHWKIYDRATSKLMRHFYKAYQAHHDPARALHTAMLRMLQDNHGPQDWAAFAVIGATSSTLSL